MNNPLVSVIMPIYNGEQFIQKSIGSIFRQTYHHIELIAVNDGSSDQSLKLLKQLRKSAPNHVQMQILSQENQGICHSRNNALDIAKGKYIMFIDQDDFMKKDCVEQLCKEIEMQNADIVIGGFELVDKNDKVLEKWQLDSRMPWSKFRITAPWGRVFRKEIIDVYHIRFMVTKISEDFYFNMLYMSYCKNICVSSYCGYCWLYNESSESHANMSRLADDRNPLVMLTQLHIHMNKPNILESEYVEYMMIKHIIWYLFYVAKSAGPREIKSIYMDCMHWLGQYYPDFKKNKLLKRGKPKGEDKRKGLIVRTSVMLSRLHLLYPLLMVYSKV